MCVNTDGSYTCQCRTGYQLNGDGRTCSGEAAHTNDIVKAGRRTQCSRHGHNYVMIEYVKYCGGDESIMTIAAAPNSLLYLPEEHFSNASTAMGPELVHFCFLRPCCVYNCTSC